MRIYEERILPEEYLDPHPLFYADPAMDTQARAVGWHAGEIIKAIESSLDKKVAAKYGKPKAPSSKVEWNWLMLMGFAWEHYMVRRIPSISGTTHQPGEIGCETGLAGFSACGRNLGVIYGNPDGETEEVLWKPEGHKASGLIVDCTEEFKLSKMSSRHRPETHWKFHTQVKTYLKMKSEEQGKQRTHARLYANFVNDDYAGFGKGGSPDCYVACWWIEYDWQEIEDNWKVLVSWLAQQKVS